jgi:hypothetical protein
MPANIPPDVRSFLLQQGFNLAAGMYAQAGRTGGAYQGTSGTGGSPGPQQSGGGESSSAFVHQTITRLKREFSDQIGGFGGMAGGGGSSYGGFGGMAGVGGMAGTGLVGDSMRQGMVGSHIRGIARTGHRGQRAAGVGGMPPEDSGARLTAFADPIRHPLKMPLEVGKSLLTLDPIGAISAITKPARETARAVGELPSKLERWGDELLESRRNIMRFNSQILTAMKQSERRAIMRNIQSGARTAGSTEYLQNALDNLRETLQPLRDIITNFGNIIAGTLLHILNFFYKTFSPLAALTTIADLIREWLGIQKASAQIPIEDFLRNLRDLNRNAPPRRGGP